MFTIDINITGWRLIIDSILVINPINPRIGMLIHYLLEINNAVPLTEFLFKLQPGGEYNYKITALDTRLWKQDINIAATPELTEMNFNVDDFWKLPEFSPQRAARDLVIRMAIDYQIDRIKMTF